jgi:cytosol aminopeptidase family protein
MKITIPKAVSVGLMLLVLGGVEASFATEANSEPAEKTFNAPDGLKVSVKIVGPYTEPADLQIITLFKHKASGDTYQGAAKDTDEHLHGILSALRNRGEFVGELGETFLFTPPSGSIPAKRFMVIGLGEEKDLSLDSLRVVGRIAAREAVRLNAKHVAWAPVIRDEGNTVLDVGEGDRAFIEQMLSAYHTEKRLQAEALAPAFSIEDLVIEAGPTYFDDVAKQVGEGIESMTTVLAQRNAAPYGSATKQ